MPKIKKNASSSKPSATSLSTPIYHRRRRDWRDDQKLIEEIASLIQKKNGPYDLKNKAVHEFLEIAENIKLTGYESNAQATFLAMWIREELSKLFHKKHGYNLKAHVINIPTDLPAVLHKKRPKVY